MALTKTPVELQESSTPSIVDGGNATAITIDSSEDVTLANNLEITSTLKVSGKTFGFGTTAKTDSHSGWNQFYIGQKGNIFSENATGTHGLDGLWLTDNLYVDSDTGSFANIETNESSAIKLEGGQLHFYSQASGSAGAAVTLSEKFKIDGDGVSTITTSTPKITFIETDQSNKQYQIGSFGAAFAIYDASNSQYRYTLTTDGDHIFNEGGQNCDFRVETDDEANMFNIVGGSNMVMIGSTTAVATSQFQISSTSDRHQLTLTSGSNTSISTSGSGDYAEGVVAIPSVSSGNVLSIPIYSQANLWRPMYVELMFVSGEYNKTSGKGGFAKLTFAALTSISGLSEVAVGGNVASVSSSGMNITVTFTTAYNAGLNDKEGVYMHYKVLSYTPDYFQAWNATLN